MSKDYLWFYAPLVETVFRSMPWLVFFIPYAFLACYYAHGWTLLISSVKDVFSKFLPTIAG